MAKTHDIHTALGANPGAARAISMMKDQLLLILVDRMGGEFSLTSEELDTVPVGKVLTLDVEDDPSTGGKVFRLKAMKK